MTQYINKENVEEILRNLWKEDDGTNPGHRICYNKALQEVQCALDAIEVKTDEDNSLEKFKSLLHINKDLNKTLHILGYIPNLYYLDGTCYVDWISCKECDTIKSFKGNTPEEAIDKAYNWFHSTFCNS